MSAHPLVDALIAQKQSEIDTEYENILKNIEEHYAEHSIKIKIHDANVVKLIENGFRIERMKLFGSANDLEMMTLISW